MTRCNILGVDVAALDLETASRAVLDWVERREAGYVCVTGVHGVMESWRDPDLKRVHNQAGLVVPDGMPLVWIARLRRFPNVGRVYGPDLLHELCRRTEGGPARHFFYGGAEGVAERLVERLLKQYPALRIAGIECPPFRPLSLEEDDQVVERINRSGADVVWVGLGTPKQERWMSEHVGRLDAPALIGVGAAFDFLAGLKRQAPRWMQRSGLEWSFRLATEPRRLWRRYLINNPLFIALVVAQGLGLRRVDVENDGAARLPAT